MAKRKFNQKARVLQPAVMKLRYALQTPQSTIIDGVPQPASSTHYISITRDISRLNRRFYRQGLNLAIANVKVTTLPAAPTVQGSQCYINAIPHTWSVANAWMKAFSYWRKQQDDALENSDSEETVARFRDFKISMEDGHVVGSTETPVNLGPGRFVGPFLPGIKFTSDLQSSPDWQSSEIVIPNDGAPGVTGQYDLHMVGADTAISKGMIQGYCDSRAVPQSPDPVGPNVSSSWMQEMFDVGNDNLQVTDNAQNRNDDLPYDQDDYPGGDSNFINLECQGYNLNQSTVGLNTFNTGPFTAPCGLLRVDVNDVVSSVSSGAGSFTIVTVELVPGNHRGYLAETMEEF